MKTKEIIKKYKPFKGFYDLRDYEIPDKEFIKLWSIQEFLSDVRDKKEYYKKYSPYQWEYIKEISANYQQILLNKNKYEKQKNK